MGCGVAQALIFVDIFMIFGLGYSVHYAFVSTASEKMAAKHRSLARVTTVLLTCVSFVALGAASDQQKKSCATPEGGGE